MKEKGAVDEFDFVSAAATASAVAATPTTVARAA
jgi:hypothetical protein